LEFPPKFYAGPIHLNVKDIPKEEEKELEY